MMYHAATMWKQDAPGNISCPRIRHFLSQFFADISLLFRPNYSEESYNTHVVVGNTTFDNYEGIPFIAC